MSSHAEKVIKFPKQILQIDSVTELIKRVNSFFTPRYEVTLISVSADDVKKHILSEFNSNSVDPLFWVVPMYLGDELIGGVGFHQPETIASAKLSRAVQLIEEIVAPLYQNAYRNEFLKSTENKLSEDHQEKVLSPLAKAAISNLTKLQNSPKTIESWDWTKDAVETPTYSILLMSQDEHIIYKTALELHSRTKHIAFLRFTDLPDQDRTNAVKLAEIKDSTILVPDLCQCPIEELRAISEYIANIGIEDDEGPTLILGLTESRENFNSGIAGDLGIEMNFPQLQMYLSEKTNIRDSVKSLKTFM